MNLSRAFLFFSITLAMTSVARAEDAKTDQRVYLIGNSLTWDTVPTKLDGHVKYHVDCGKSLPYMVANPETPCVKSSSLWPQTLPDEVFDVVCLQVHYGSTFAEDLKAIDDLIQHQPNATVVIHSGWAREAQRAAEWNEEVSVTDDTEMIHNAAYYRSLLDTLRRRHPQQTFGRTFTADALQIVQDDIEAGDAPIETLSQLYRDKIHMDLVTGRYLMHNAMRQAIGQPRSAVGFEKLSEKMKDYLDSVLDRVDVAR